jgi:outer membrane protein OmpU
MKHMLLATTALVTMTGAAAAELSITATARVGLKTTEGTAAKTTAAVGGQLNATEMGTLEYLVGEHASTTTKGTAVDAAAEWTAATVAASALAAVYTEIRTLISDIEVKQVSADATIGATSALAADLATAKLIQSRAVGTAASTAAAVADDTSAVNRIRVSFTGSGETDSGISYGATIRADNSAAGAAATGGTGGSQFVSGAFGKISMGDLNGADETAAGGGVSGVGLTGLGDHNDISYQSSDHNLSYSYSTAGLTFGYSQDTTVNTGSNSAMGVKYSGDVGGATISVGVGQSKVSTATQSSMSVSASSGGMTLTAMSSTNDNGPAVDAVTARIASSTTLTHRDAADRVANNDTDQTAISISYSMDAMTVTGFSKTVSTSGAADQDFSGFGFAYDMGGVSLKAGVVDNNDQQLIDFGLSFSF